MAQGPARSHQCDAIVFRFEYVSLASKSRQRDWWRAFPDFVCRVHRPDRGSLFFRYTAGVDRRGCCCIVCMGHPLECSHGGAGTRTRGVRSGVEQCRQARALGHAHCGQSAGRRLGTDRRTRHLGLCALYGARDHAGSGPQIYSRLLSPGHPDARTGAAQCMGDLARGAWARPRR